MKLKMLAVILFWSIAWFSHAGNLSVSVADKGLRTSGTVMRDQPMVTTSFFTPIGSEGYYFGAYWFSGLDDDFDRDALDETGLFVGKVGTKENWRYDFGLSYFNLVSMKRLWDIGDEVRLHGDLSYQVYKNETFELSPFARLEYKVVSELPNGTYTHLGTRFNWRISSRTKLKGETALLHNSGVYGSERGWGAYMDASLQWPLSNNLTLELPKVRVTTPITVEDKTSQYSIGLGINWRF